MTKELLNEIENDYWNEKADPIDMTEVFDLAKKALEQEPCEDCISRKVVLDLVEDMTDQFGVEHRVITEGVISMLPPVTSKPKTDVLDKIRAEIEKPLRDERCFDTADAKAQYIALNWCIEIIDKYKAESEG